MIGSPTTPVLSSTLAGADAEYQSGRRAKGRPSKCPRGRYREPIPAEVCVADYRAGEPECMRDCGCSVGRVLNEKMPREESMGSKYGKCKLCGRKGALDAGGLCYLPKCKEARKAQADHMAGGQSAQVAPTETSQQPEIDEESQGREVAACEECAMSDTVLPEDMDRPFELGGFTFPPAPPRRATGTRGISIIKSGITILQATVEDYQIQNFSHAKFVLSTNGKAIAVKFYDHPAASAVKIQRKSSGFVLSAGSMLREHPSLIGSKAALSAMPIRGWFLAVLDGEAA